MTYERWRAQIPYTTDGRKVAVDTNPSTLEVVIYVGGRKLLRFSAGEALLFARNLDEAAGALATDAAEWTQATAEGMPEHVHHNGIHERCDRCDPL